MINIGIGIPFGRRRAGGGLSQEALTWKANIEANGGTISLDVLALVDEFVISPSVASGDWVEHDRLNLWCGLNGFQIAARTCMIRGTLITPVSSPIFDNDGYKSAGAGSYLNLNYNPSTQAVKMQRNSSLQYVIIRNPTYTGTKRHIGGANFTGTNPRIDHLRQGDFFVFQSDTSASSNSNISTSGNVFLAGRRSAASGENSKEVIINSNVQGFNVASTILPNISLFELSANYDGTPSSDVDTDYHRCSGNGSSLINHANMRTRFNNLFAEMGL